MVDDIINFINELNENIDYVPPLMLPFFVPEVAPRVVVPPE